MSLQDLVRSTRSTRRFQQDEPVSLKTLRELVDLARLTASSANIQPLKYILIADPATNARIFPFLRWAGYLPDWPGPTEGERPAAAIIILGDRELHRRFDTDLGIAAQTIMLAATERGLAGCMIASIERNALRAALDIHERFEILLALPLGKPAETVVLEVTGPDGDIRYYRDEKDIHHVPKRPLEEVIVREVG